jgi:hypothetical protein
MGGEASTVLACWGKLTKLYRSGAGERPPAVPPGGPSSDTIGGTSFIPLNPVYVDGDSAVTAASTLTIKAGMAAATRLRSGSG